MFLRCCPRPGGHLLITVPTRDSTSRTSENLYWRLRAACYHLVPGVVRFYDTNSLTRLVEDQCPDRRRVQGRARSRERVGSLITSPVECALQRRIAGAQNDVVNLAGQAR